MNPSLLAACLIALSTVMPDASAQPATPPLQELDRVVEAARERFEVPGIAVAVVKDGEVLLERGWGVRDLATGEPAGPRTLFAIASNTKAFTAMALNMLAEDGKLELEDRVIDHLPWFRMSDPYVTREMRIRDLLAHRSGLSLGAGDLLYWPATDYTNEDVAKRLKDVPLTGGFREKYAYDNILYGVAQLVIEDAAGMSFERFLQTRIFDPLGMATTRYNADALRPGDEVATGYAKADFTELQPAPRMTWANVAGAGGLYSSAHDLATWMRTLLAGTAYAGRGDDARRLVPEARLRGMWQMITPIPPPKASVPELEPAIPAFHGYAEGWSVGDFRGRKLVWHTGGWPGMVSRVTLVPELGIGVAVLTNAEVGAAFNSVTYSVLDMLMGVPGHDWVDAYGKAVDKARAESDTSWQKHLERRDAKSRPSLSLDGYAGTYRDPWYGDVVVERDGGGLRMRFTRTPALTGRLEHWQHDSFIVRWDERWLNADAFVDFSLDHDARIREVRMKAVSPLTDFSFDFHDLRLAPVVEASAKADAGA